FPHQNRGVVRTLRDLSLRFVLAQWRQIKGLPYMMQPLRTARRGVDDQIDPISVVVAQSGDEWGPTGHGNAPPTLRGASPRFCLTRADTRVSGRRVPGREHVIALTAPSRALRE